LPPIPPPDSDFQDPRSEIWVLAIQTLRVIQENDKSAALICRQKLPQMLLRIVFSTSKTIPPSVRCNAATLLQTLSVKIPRWKIDEVVPNEKRAATEPAEKKDDKKGASHKKGEEQRKGEEQKNDKGGKAPASPESEIASKLEDVR
jgi:hypothetical protein